METSRPLKQQYLPHNNSYRAEDIIAEYGSLANFMAAVGPKAPLEIPDLGFTEEESRRMGEILAQENHIDSQFSVN